MISRDCSHQSKRLFFQYSTSSRRCLFFCLFSSKHQYIRAFAKISLGSSPSRDEEFTHYLPMACTTSLVSSLTEASSSNDFTLYGWFAYCSTNTKGDGRSSWLCNHRRSKCWTRKSYMKDKRILTIKVFRMENNRTVNYATKNTTSDQC